MDRIIIGLVGELASGKDTVADHLKEKYGSETISFSKSLRDILDRLFLPQTRQNMANLGIDLRARFGQDLLAKVIAEDVKKDTNSIVVIDGIRRPDDIKYLNQIPGFILINIFADMSKRFERITQRVENTDDTKKTYKEFSYHSRFYV